MIFVFRVVSIIFIILLITSKVHSSQVSSLSPLKGKIIRNIEIVRKNVFDDELLKKPHFYYRWANSLHIKTKESVIRRELLYRVGEPLNVEDVIETERNLRSLGFIGEVNTNIKENAPDSVDVTVTTMDYWTTKLALSLDAAGGKYSIGIEGTEANVLGLGKFIQLSGLVGNDQTGIAAGIADPRLFGSRLAVSAAYQDFTYDKQYAIHFHRPQYSVKVPYSFRVDAAKTNMTPRLFRNDREYFRYNEVNRLFDTEGVYSFGRFRKLSFSSEYTYNKYNFGTEPDQDTSLNKLLPDNETMSYPSIDIRGDIIGYGLERYLDRGGTPEDLTLGAGLKFRTGYSAKSLGSNYIGTLHWAIFHFLINPRPKLFIGGIDRVSWAHRNGRNERIRQIAEGSVYYRTFRTQVLAFHFLTDFAWRQREFYQLILGGGNGLRGFPYYQFSGSKLALSNVEYRFFLPLEILTVRPGGVVFFDAGNVWQSHEKLHARDLKSDIGVGLRFALLKSSTAQILRLDFARSLSDNNFFISFGSGSTFSLQFKDQTD